MQTKALAGIMTVQVVEEDRCSWLIVTRPEILRDAHLMGVELSPGESPGAPVSHLVRGSRAVPAQGLAFRLPVGLAFPMRVAVRWLPAASVAGHGVNRSEVWLGGYSDAALTGVRLSEDGAAL